MWWDSRMIPYTYGALNVCQALLKTLTRIGLLNPHNNLHQRGQPALLSLPIQIAISPRNSLTETPE